MNTQEHIALARQYGADNYAPLEVVIESAEGAWVTDVDGRRYLDMLSSYSALNFGHGHPRLTKALTEQLGRVVVTSRAFYNDQYGPFCRELAEFCGMEWVLPMNSGAEAVETAIKTARKWGYDVKGVPDGEAEIICCENNFHGRTTTIVSFSTDPIANTGFGPPTPGFKIAPFGDLAATEALMTDRTVAVLIEPIQGEAGILMPPEGFFKKLEALCKRNNVLLMVDEIQTGLGRAGKKFAHYYDDITPDVLILGKALGGGLLPVSAVVSSKAILGVLTPGTHGSTFGGMPLSCAVAREALRLLEDEKLADRAAESGAYLMDRLREMNSPAVCEVRGRGLLIGMELKPEAGTAKKYCLALQEQGLLCKDTHEQVIRFAPPLIIDRKDIDWALERIERVFSGAQAEVSR
ncbi:MAG: ornithine--oxo-acid transaminase [Planctomycetes bacterium]|nr:ornithine--oxo-acid transaminase [Planctomycetota bacterium]